MVTEANRTAERRTSEMILKAKSKADCRITADADKVYDMWPIFALVVRI